MLQISLNLQPGAVDRMIIGRILILRAVQVILCSYERTYCLGPAAGGILYRVEGITGKCDGTAKYVVAVTIISELSQINIAGLRIEVFVMCYAQ